MAKIAFVFPGQGTQYAGMGKKLYEVNDENKKIIDKIFENNEDVKKVIFEGTDEEIKNTKYAQPAIALFSVVLTKLLKEKGIKIPKDVSIIGFDDIPYSAVSSPALTTVHVQRNQIGKLAVEKLLKMKKDRKIKSAKTLITGNLIVRDSVAKKA